VVVAAGSLVKLLCHCLKKKQSSPVEAVVPPKKTTKRPPSLKINIIPQQEEKSQDKSRAPPTANKASTTVSEIPTLATNGHHTGDTTVRLRKRTSDSTKISLFVEGTRESKENSAKADSSKNRRSTIQIVGSVDDKNSSLSFSQMFSKKIKNLSYNRSTMKKPAASADFPSSSMEETMTSTGERFKEDSYIPKIAEHTKSWPYILARNYFFLRNIVLFVTFLINILLLTYKVDRYKG